MAAMLTTTLQLQLQDMYEVPFKVALWGRDKAAWLEDGRIQLGDVILLLGVRLSEFSGQAQGSTHARSTVEVACR